MHKILVKHGPEARSSNATDGYYLFIALITAVILSSIAIMLGVGLAMIAGCKSH
jgi:hypothetical protein